MYKKEIKKDLALSNLMKRFWNVCVRCFTDNVEKNIFFVTTERVGIGWDSSYSTISYCAGAESE